MNDNLASVKDEDTLRINQEIKRMSIKEMCERAIASGVMIHNLEYKQKITGEGLSAEDRAIIARLNREMDVLMRIPKVREWFEHECSYGGSAVIWTPNN